MLISLRHYLRSLPRRLALGPSKGFTLIELMVVVAIMVLITTAVLIRQSRFDSSTLLRSLSYSIALSIRSAQVYGTSVLGVKSGGVTLFAPAYGVYFNNQNSYLLFADVNGNGAYDPAVDTIVETYQVGAGFRISKFCGVLADGSKHCSSDGSLTWMTVYFKRPNPDALVASSAGESYNGAYIQIIAINDASNTHSISVSSTGEIAVGVAGS